MGFLNNKKNKLKPNIMQDTQIVSPEHFENNLEIQINAKNPLGGIAWYQKNYYIILKLLTFVIFCLIISIAFSIYLYVTRPKPVYYAVTPDLQVAKLVPLNKPVLSEQGLINWTADVVTSSISLDFLDWREKLQSVKPNFSNEAFASFTKSMTDAGILKMIQEKRLNLSSVVKQAPVITNSGIINGVMSWKIEFPILLSYESSEGVELTQELLAEVIVSRASTISTPRGVVLKQVVLKRG